MDQSKILNNSHIALSWVTSSVCSIIKDLIQNFDSCQPIQADSSHTNPAYKLGSARTCIEADVNHDLSHPLYPHDD